MSIVLMLTAAYFFLIFGILARINLAVSCLVLFSLSANAAILPDQPRDFYKRYDAVPQPAFQSNLDGLALLSQVNHYFNRTVKYVPDDSDYWQTPAETAAKGAGDCEDIALAKWGALKDNGVPEKDMWIKVSGINKKHAVLMVRLNDEIFYLDNETNNLWEQTITDRSAYIVNRSGLVMSTKFK